MLRTALVAGTGLAAGTVAACAAPSAPSAGPAAPPAALHGRTLLAYFSRAGENYFYGGRKFLDVGNTQVLADMIASMARVDVYRIEAADPYPDSYDQTVQRNTREQDADARPAIAGSLPAAADYDTVLVGSPIWKVRPPMIMSTFLDGFDASGKTVLPFVTYAVSRLGNTVDVYRRLSPRATLGEPLAILGEEVQQAGPEIEKWLRAASLAN